MVKSFFDVVNRYKQFVISIGVLLLVILVGVSTPSFALSSVVPSVVISSENEDYNKNDPGAWQIEKSAKWISNDKARVTFNVDTIAKVDYQYIDVIFVLDISSSMVKEKIDRVRQDMTELLDTLFSNAGNRAALITFSTESQIVSEFTNNKDLLVQKINDLQCHGDTNYYQPLVNVDNILKNYQKEEGREVVVLFLTDGYPNKDTPNQIAQYRYLKSEYPYITINGVQYEMGSSILDPIKEISDNQFYADMDTLNNILFSASVLGELYEEFQIVDYIEDEYFLLESEDDIVVNWGEVKLEEENGLQKITWTIPRLPSGYFITLTMDLQLRVNYLDRGGNYSTNERVQIISNIDNQTEQVTSTLTPVLQRDHQVFYDGNAPDGCSVENVPESEMYFVFNTVSISEEEPTCNGYQFKRWEVVTDGITKINDDYFVMPDDDIVIRAKWAKLSISKSMDGIVSEQEDPIMKGQDWWPSSLDKSTVTSIVTKDNTEIPATATSSWNVDVNDIGSVVAYLEDDGSGNGYYKVTIGGDGGIIANPDCSYLFSSFRRLNHIDLTYLDTSQVTNMSRMFSNLMLLGANLSLDLGMFDTSNVVDMSFMFSQSTAIIDLNITGFDTSNVTNMSGMFYALPLLKNIEFGEKWDTSKVTNMSQMFQSCNNLVELDLSRLDTSNVTNMSQMFYGCYQLSYLDMRNAVFNATEYDDMFLQTLTPVSITVLVGDNEARNWIQLRLDESGRSSIVSVV